MKTKDVFEEAFIHTEIRIKTKEQFLNEFGEPLPDTPILNQVLDILADTTFDLRRYQENLYEREFFC